MVSSGFTVILEHDLLLIDSALRDRGILLSFPHCVLACGISSTYILGVTLISSMTHIKKKAFMAVNKIMELGG